MTLENTLKIIDKMNNLTSFFTYNTYDDNLINNELSINDINLIEQIPRIMVFTDVNRIIISYFSKNNDSLNEFEIDKKYIIKSLRAIWNKINKRCHKYIKQYFKNNKEKLDDDDLIWFMGIILGQDE